MIPETVGCTWKVCIDFDKSFSKNVERIYALISNYACALLSHFDANITNSPHPLPGLVWPHCSAGDLLSCDRIVEKEKKCFSSTLVSSELRPLL